MGGEVAVAGADGGQRGLFEGDSEPLGALRVRPERRLPADWLLPGERPAAQEARWRAVGKTRMSVPISATMTSAVRAATPVMVAAGATPASRAGPSSVSIASGESLDLLVEEVQVGEHRADDEGVVGLKAALERFAQRGQLGAQATLGEFGESDGVGGAGHERVEPDVVERLSPEPGLVVVGEGYERWLAAHEPRDPGGRGDADDVIVQMYTSGTTGCRRAP
jgi:hypothetical protein